ncbi:subtilisin-like serine protease [Haplosporangium sp. Z 767]|nr:subtilisin-like serine protease [Haplosporangium sp. Z 767]
MKTQQILLLSIAIASIALAAEVPPRAGAQAALAVPKDQNDALVPQGTQEQLPSSISLEEKKGNAEEEDVHEDGVETEDNPTQAYMYDPSKSSTHGYDENGRQEVVNVGPSLKTTAEGQTQSRTGPRGRQRGAVLPHKYIVRLKNGADFTTLNIRSRVAAHNRMIHIPPDGEPGQQRVEQEIVPNQVDHEYDFGTWKGYAGQFSPEFLKELKSQDEVEYVEEDTMMWAWGVDVGQTDKAEFPTAVEDSQQGLVSNEHYEALDPTQDPTTVYSMATNVTQAQGFAGDAIINGRNVDIEYHSTKTPNWGLTRIAQRQRNPQGNYTYMSTAGKGVDVYIIDSGVFAEHIDFGGRAVNIANFVAGEVETDTCGHGTHVAGIVAGRRYGVAKAARINAIKVLDAEGQGSTSQVLAGINYMIRHASSNPNPRKVINMSLGGQFSRPVNDAVRAAVTRHGLPFFVAAGNTGDDACQYSPAGVGEAFAVGGSDRYDRVGWYSCVGACVSIFAPGSGIPSDWIRSRTATHILDGTSMASPHVAGVAALFLGADNKYSSASELYADLIRHSTKGVINGLPSSDQKTSRNLLYNKLEDIPDSYVVKSRDGVKAQDERKKKGFDKKKKVHMKKKMPKRKGRRGGHHL